MYKLSVLKNRILILSVFILMAACGGNDPGESAIELQTKKLTGTWKPAATNGVTRDGVYQEGWDAFTLTFNKGTYTTSASENETVWPPRGTWNFVNDNVNKILRDEVVLLDIQATETTLQITLTISNTANGRVRSINGEYVFTLVKQ